MGSRMGIVQRRGWIRESRLRSRRGFFDPIQNLFDLFAICLGVTGQVALYPIYDVVAVVEGRVCIFKMQQYPVLEARDADDGVQRMTLGVVAQLV